MNVEKMVSNNEEVMIKVEEDYQYNPSDEYDHPSMDQIESAVDEIFANTLETKIKFEKVDFLSNKGEQLLLNIEKPSVKAEGGDYASNELSFEFEEPILSKVKMEIDGLLSNCGDASNSEGEGCTSNRTSKRYPTEHFSLNNGGRILEAETIEFSNELPFEFEEPVLNKVRMEGDEFLSNESESTSCDTNTKTEKSLWNNKSTMIETENDKCLSNDLSFEFKEPILSKVKMKEDEFLSSSGNASNSDGELHTSIKASKEKPILREVKVVLERIDKDDIGLFHKRDINGAEFNRNSKVIKDLQMMTGKKPYKCKRCGKRFVQVCTFQKHLRKHAREKPHKCDVCQKEFYRLSRFKTHSLIHTGEKPYKCDFCKRRFTQKGTLQAHIRTHTGEKPYKCDECGKEFSRSDNLKLHVRTHTGAKPYNCCFCQRGFSNKGLVQRHMRIHSGEKPYKCDVCGKTFTRDTNLQEHVRIHTGEKPYECDVCGMRFARRYSLRGHKSVHTGLKPYKCDFCESKFTKKTSLQRHACTHTGKKPYKCDICGKKFGRKDNLQQHIRLHTR